MVVLGCYFRFLRARAGLFSFVFFVKQTRYGARYSIGGSSFWRFDSPEEERTAGITRVLVPNIYG